jgi:gliding motility-associated-like protein
MIKFKNTVFPVLILLGVLAQSQGYPINTNSGQTISTCLGTFTDSGGSFDNPYQPNESYSVSFCSNNQNSPVVVFHFTHFQLGAGDVLRVYDGDNAFAPLLWEATGTQLQGKSVYASTGCLHFVFQSSPSEQGLGWEAQISCMSICETFRVEIQPQGGKFDFCPEVGNVFFSATAFYLPQNIQFAPPTDTFSWVIDGTSYQGQNQTHSFMETGIYPLSVSVSDPNFNCTAQSNRFVRLGTVPNFNGTRPMVAEVCAKEPFTLSGRANPNIWTPFSSSHVGLDAIPDGTGLVYQSGINFDVFDSEAVISTSYGVSRVCIDIEHARHGQLQIQLECPQGSRTMLKNFSPAQANLGEPVVWNTNTPGVPYTYCFLNDATRTINLTTPSFHSYVDQSGNFYANASYIPSGNYRPDQGFQNLGGCPINGEWKLIITDNSADLNGFVFGWSIYFDDDLYPPGQINYPRIIDGKWFSGTTQLQGNPATHSISQPGFHDLKFMATDSYGCSYDTIVKIFVKKLPEAEFRLPVGRELPICRGDSILLALSPINVVNPNWSYQWVVGTTPIPGETTTTKMARTPGTYRIRVTDNDTGCIEFFEIAVTDQDCQLEIPNVFTPNGDGINDLFEIRNLEHFSGEIIIYNRWGRVVFEHPDYYGNWWDGIGYPDGTYYYVLNYERDGEIQRAEGVITIIR